MRVERHGRVAVVRLDDPAHRNALSSSLNDGVVAAFDALGADDGVHAIVLTATAPVFCAGGYLPDLVAEDRPPMRHSYRAFEHVADCPVPVVAAVTGPAIGAGINLVLAADVAVAAPGATLDVRFLDVGIHPGGGFSAQLQRAVGSRRAAALILLAGSLSAPEALAAGLVHAVADDAEAHAIALAERIAARPRPLLVRTKATLRHNLWAASEGEAFEHELDSQAWSMAQPEFLATVEHIRARLAGSASTDPT